LKSVLLPTFGRPTITRVGSSFEVFIRFSISYESTTENPPRRIHHGDGRVPETARIKTSTGAVDFLVGGGQSTGNLNLAR
jgi:hypothetical protein